MDVLVLIDKLDDLVHNAKPVPLTDQVRVDKEEIYDILDQMRATIPEEIKQARWIVKERQEMLAEAKREAERIVKEARERQTRLVSEQEVTKQAERAAEDIIEDARAREREIRLGAEDYADEILNTLEVNLTKFIAAVQRGRERLQGKDEPGEPRGSRVASHRVGVERAERSIEIGGPPVACFDAVLDFESYPQWQSLVQECRVLERDAEGRGSVVETVVDARIRTLRYVLAYSYDPPHRRVLGARRGRPRVDRGRVRLRALSGHGRSPPTASRSTSAGWRMLVPGDVKRKATEHLMRSSVEELKARVEADE